MRHNLHFAMHAIMRGWDMSRELKSGGTTATLKWPHSEIANYYYYENWTMSSVAA